MMFRKEIRGLREYAVMVDDASFGPCDMSLNEWNPQMPAYKVHKSKVAQLNRVMQLNATAMLQVSRALAGGNIKSARTKLRTVFRRMDAALHQMDRLQRETEKQR